MDDEQFWLPKGKNVRKESQQASKALKLKFTIEEEKGKNMKLYNCHDDVGKKYL